MKWSILLLGGTHRDLVRSQRVHAGIDRLPPVPVLYGLA